MHVMRDDKFVVEYAKEIDQTHYSSAQTKYSRAILFVLSATFLLCGLCMTIGIWLIQNALHIGLRPKEMLSRYILWIPLSVAILYVLLGIIGAFASCLESTTPNPIAMSKTRFCEYSVSIVNKRSCLCIFVIFGTMLWVIQVIAALGVFAMVRLSDTVAITSSYEFLDRQAYEAVNAIESAYYNKCCSVSSALEPNTSESSSIVRNLDAYDDDNVAGDIPTSSPSTIAEYYYEYYLEIAKATHAPRSSTDTDDNRDEDNKNSNDNDDSTTISLPARSYAAKIELCPTSTMDRNKLCSVQTDQAPCVCYNNEVLYNKAFQLLPVEYCSIIEVASKLLDISEQEFNGYEHNAGEYSGKTFQQHVAQVFHRVLHPLAYVLIGVSVLLFLACCCSLVIRSYSR